MTTNLPDDLGADEPGRAGGDRRDQGTAGADGSSAGRPGAAGSGQRAGTGAATGGDAGSEPARFTGLFGMRRARIAAEIRRNREAEHAVPTWVLAVILLVLVAAIVAALVL